MLKELKAHHRNILQMSFNGFSGNDIAARLEISPITVSNIIRSPMGKAYLNGLEDKMAQNTLDVRKELVSMNRKALATFNRLLDPKQKAPPAVQANIAKDILDRSGFKAPDKINIDLTMQTKTDAEIDAEIAALEDSINKVQPIPLSKEENSEESTEELPEENSESSDILDDAEFDPFHNIEKSE